MDRLKKALLNREDAKNAKKTRANPLRPLRPSRLRGESVVFAVEQGGVFWIEVPDEHLETALSRLPLLGYTTAVKALLNREDAKNAKKTRANPLRPLRPSRLRGESVVFAVES